MHHGIDAHCHLEFMADPVSVIATARTCMNGFVTSVAHPEHATEMLALAEENKGFVHAALGIHPTSALQVSSSEFDGYMDFVKNNEHRIVAVGEVGLDYHHVTDEEDMQKTKELFLQFIELANSIKKPLVIHTRNAMPDTLKMLESAKTGVMMHFFSGTNEELGECLQRGYYVSYTTMTCISKKYRKLAKHTPLDRMLLETDAPWLDPVKNDASGEENKTVNGQEKTAEKKASDYEGDAFSLTNRPWKIALTAEKLEKELHVPKEEILGQTEKNARKLFCL